MSETQSIPKDICEKLDALAESMKINNIDKWYEPLEKVFRIFSEKERIRHFADILESMEKELKEAKKKVKEESAKGEEEEKKTVAHIDKSIAKIRKLLSSIKKNEPDALLQAINRKGFHCAQDIELNKSIQSAFFKILQQIRLGKREDVIHSFMQIFAAKQKQMPRELIETLKQEWHIDQFRAFAYAFLSNFTGKDNYND